MNNSSKTYIGKGTQINDYDMFNVSIDITEAEKFMFEFEGKKYLRFTLTKMKKADMKGRQFTAYAQAYEQKSVNQTVKETNAKAAKKSRKKAQEPELNFQMQH